MKTPLRPIPLLPAAILFCLPLQAQEPLSLSQAVARALERNPELAIDLPAREAAVARLDASRAGYLPRVDFEQSWTGSNNPVYVFGTLLTQRRFTAANFALSSLNRPDAIDNLQTRITAQQTLWDFGRTRLQREAARAGVEIADHSREDHRREVQLAVLDAYYSVSLSREAREAARAALESAESIVSRARSRVQTGLAVEADLLRSQVQLAAARQQEIQAGGQLEIAVAMLNRLMGEPLEGAIGPTAPLEPVALPLPDEDALRSEMLARRPDYQRLLAEVRQADIEANARQSDLWPVIGSFAQWEADNPSLGSAGGTNWTAGISLRWNIFAGGADAARLRASRHALEQKRRQLAAMESAMALEIRQALIRCRAAEQQVEASRAVAAQSEESLRILRNRYDAGLATMTDLLSAETARAGARTALAEAVYQHRVSYARLEAAAGLLAPTSKSMNP